MSLYELFYRCINIPYSVTGISASYAFEKTEDILYIFFESSNGKNDWNVNLDFPVKAYKREDGKVWFAHRGFLSIWQEIEPMLRYEINDPSLGNIITVGYSHGAAIALLCHEYIWSNRPDLRKKIEGYGFGCPRVLWGRKTSAVKQRWERFTVIRNIDDAVTHLPPSLLGYFHVGKLLSIGQKGKYSPIEAHYEENILNELKIYENRYIEIK